MTSSLKLFLILYCILQINSKLPCVCSVIDNRGSQNVVRTSVTHSTAPLVPLFCSYHILTSSMIYYWTDAQQLGIYLLNIENRMVDIYLLLLRFKLGFSMLTRIVPVWISQTRSLLSHPPEAILDHKYIILIV